MTQKIVTDYLTTGDVANLAKVAPRTAAKWMDKYMPSYRMPDSRGRRVLWSDFEEFCRTRNIPLGEQRKRVATSVLVVSNLKDTTLQDFTHLSRVLDGFPFKVVVEYALFRAGMYYQKLLPSVVIFDFALSQSDCLIAMRAIKLEDGPKPYGVAVRTDEPVDEEELKLMGFDIVVDRRINPYELYHKLKNDPDLSTAKK